MGWAAAIYKHANKSHLTAITRSTTSAPLRWLESEGHIKGRVLDFGSGKGFDAEYLGCAQFDPYYYPVMQEGKFDTILCTYVYNVLPKEEWYGLTLQILDKLRKDGTGYVSVRNDQKNLRGITTKGTYQTNVDIPYPILTKNSSFKIFQVFKCRSITSR
jgi:hypothetical protein